MGKRPPKNANPGGGKKKKRSRVQRDYDDGDDVMVDSAPPKGRGPRETQGRMEALRTRWTRVREASYLQAQAKRFEKPKPAPKPKGKTQTQRRRGAAPRGARRGAGALGIGARGEDDDGEVPEEASGSEEEEDGEEEEEAEVDEDAEEEEGIEARQRRHDRRVADTAAAPVEARKGVAVRAAGGAEPTERFKTLLDDGADGGADGGAPRDQGLTRARLCGGATSRLGRLRRECGPGDDDEEGGATKREGPPDWEAVFGGNCDDDASVGVALVPGKRRACKFFADYERNGADVVVATPLNVRLAAERAERPCLDHLGSVELAVLDMADVLLYQNWDHVERALGACNGPPSAVDADVSRVREPYLDGHGAACRQLVALSRFADARLRSLVDAPGPGSLRNRAGAVRLAAPPTADAASGLGLAAAREGEHVFQSLRASAPARAADAKVRYFRDDVLSPQFVQSLRDDSRDDRTLVYCASYPEFVACRAALRAKGAPFLAIHEYSRGSEVSRARSRFFHGEQRLLLYSGRAHCYHRYRVRGATNFVFVSPPDHAHFYPELLDLAKRADEPTRSLCLYTRFDALALERVLGATRAAACLRKDAHAGNHAHVFTS
ncbi:U3 snoRNA binding protein [Aureococcus anophagefferens]|nr:U3 snoRNA binding protein [Aureococcus anophagefferens]